MKHLCSLCIRIPEFSAGFLTLKIQAGIGSRVTSPRTSTWILATILTLGGLATGSHAASVGLAGYTNNFSAQPPAADWTTYSITGGGTDLGSASAVDGAVQSVAAGTIVSQLGADSGNPPGATATALWSSIGLYVETRPTGNAATLLMCKLVNTLSTEAIGVAVSYDQLTDSGGTADQVVGHRAFYSLTGAAGSWVNIPQFSSATDGRLSASLSITWPSGGNLYILWADDNADGGTDNDIRIDNFSVISTPGTQTPVSITVQPQSQTVNELQPVTFTVGLSGYLPPTVQWYTNDVAIAGATSTNYSIAEVPLHFNGLQFKAVAQNVASNVTYTVTSTVAILTVNADVVAPVLQAASSVGLEQVVASFSERLSPASVSDLGNYSITGPGGVTVSAAVLDATETNLLLTVSTMVQNADYTLIISGVRDRAAASNLVAPNSQATFKALSYTSVDIGNPGIAGSASVQNGTFTAIGAGTNIAGAADQFFFYYQTVAGNFDLRTRIENLTVTDLYSKAGLMARETLAANSRFAMAAATPSSAGAFLLSRSTVGGNVTATGSLPVNYPQTWLRLIRSNTVFTGYASFDGETWAPLGSVTLSSAASTFNVGLAINSANASQSATARFQDFGPASGGTFVSDLEVPWELLGPAARNTGLIISEIMYHPKYSNDLEFVEFFNAGLITEDMSGYRLSGDVDYTFPANTILPAGGFLVVARKPALLQQAYGITGVFGPWIGAETNALPDNGGQVRLRYRHLNALLLEVNYATESPWPLSADGAGHSLVLARPSYGQDNPKAWAASERIGGSPGRMETMTGEPLRNVVINEFLANSDAVGEEDYIELYNHSTQPVDLFGAYLSDDRDTNKFRITDHVVLPARGFAAFTQTALGFALSSGGERIYLVNSNQNRVIDLVAFAGQAPGISSGRYPDGAPGFHELAAQTPGTTNSPLWIRDIVINEIMFNPPSGNDDDQFVELYNRSTNTVDLSGWRFTDGIDYSFPSNTVLAGHEYLVLVRNTTRFLSRYPEVSPAKTFGNFSGRLSHGGERIALSMPEYIFTTNGQGVVSTTVNWIPVDEVDYVDSGRWARWADGGGSSLELIDPDSDNRLAANWADSDETGKSAWTNVNHSGSLDHAYMRDAAGNLMDEVQVMILGAGEALMDDVEVRLGTSSQNLVKYPNFESDLTGWLIQGNHERSGLEPAGPNNPSQCLRIRASAGGDNGANRVECDLLSALPHNAKTNATIAARFRWLRGFPIVLIRVHGGGIEAVGTLPIPANLGTPGQANSRLVGNAGPAVYEVSHSPVLPAANQAVVVSARVSDPDGIASVEVRYRLDPSTSLSTLTMRDDGAAGDAVAGDGVYSATIPGQASGTLVAFQIAATDIRTPAGATLFPADAPTHECLVRFGDPAVAGTLGVYRIWQTAANYNRWRDRERMSNEPVDGTFVCGDYRAIYNAGARYRGSPFTRNPSSPAGSGVAANYVWTLPDDDLYLGEDELNLDCLEPGGSSNVRDVTALREVTAFRFAADLGIPFSYQRFVHVVINGITDTSRNIPIYTDSQQPNGNYVSGWFPDHNSGDLYKVDDWFEFSDSLSTGMQGNKSASLDAFYTTNSVGVTSLKQARYRWNWEKKFNQGLNDDYGSLFAAVNALTEPNANLYPSQVESVINAEEWLTALALRHVVGDWDGYGYTRGKNQFIYRPDGGKVWMLLWDLDFAIGCTSGNGPTSGLFDVSLDGLTGQNHMPEISRMYNHVHFRRVYMQALLRMADGPLQDNVYGPPLDARYRALLANGVTGLTSPYVASGAASLSLPAWIQSRRDYIYTQVAASTNVAFAVTSPTTVTSSSNLITITGNAPLGVKTIRINGQEYPLTWTTVTAWSVRVPLGEGTTLFNIQPYDLNGDVFPSSEPTVTATFNGVLADPADSIVFSELMFDPAVPGAEYVELYNRSTTTAFDLSGWRVNGIDYTFPTGAVILPRGFLVLAKDALACVSAYGTNTAIFGQYAGKLQGNGETLTLIKPGDTPDLDVVIDKVRYEGVLPWSTNATGTGSSLQLIDPAQDNSRPGNWYSDFVPAVWSEPIDFPGATNEGWRYVQYTGIVQTNGTNFLIWMQQAGDVFLDDIRLIRGTNATEGEDLLVNGDFENPWEGTWTFTVNTSGVLTATNLTNSVISTDLAHSGNSSLHVISTGAGNQNKAILQPLPFQDSNTTYTLSYWYHTSENGTNLIVRTYPGSGMNTSTNVRPQVFPPSYTPAQPVSWVTNTLSPSRTNPVSKSLPAFPPLWLNEVMPENVAGLQDLAGHRVPWIEIYNAGTNVESLEGLFLANTYTNLTQWAFPAGASINPGEFQIIFADGAEGESTLAELHTSFTLVPGTGSVALSRLYNSAPQVLDYVNYANLLADWSYGSLPNGQPFTRRLFTAPTPGEPNTAPPVTVLINEWVASNGRPNGYPDPADGDYDDWFEIYNPNAEAADISGLYLTDNLTNKTQWQIPAGHVIPPYGFKLVWADGETGQNGQGTNGDLHASFNLRAGGEAIGIFAHVGTNLVEIDSVTFVQQFENISEGRYPDANTRRYFMSTVTPRGPNVPGNSAPVVESIPDATVSAGQLLSFTIPVQDEQVPPQTLSFTLIPPVPTDAQLDPNTGVFQWTPTTDASTSNYFTVRVTDSGVPSFSAVGHFVVLVTENSEPSTATITPPTSNGDMSIGFNTIAGKHYRVEYKDDLGAADWTPLPGSEDLLATGSSLTITINISASPQRFYRIVQLD